MEIGKRFFVSSWRASHGTLTSLPLPPPSENTGPFEYIKTNFSSFWTVAVGGSGTVCLLLIRTKGSTREHKPQRSRLESRLHHGTVTDNALPLDLGGVVLRFK